MKSAPKGMARRKYKFSHWIPFYLMGLPGMLYLAVNNYLPMFGLQIAFKNYKPKLGIWRSSFVGFKNFRYLFSSSQAFRITRNTILYNLVFIILGVILGVGVAILMNEIISAASKKFYQTAILLPYLMSMVIVSYLAYSFLSPSNGFINSLIARFGGEPVSWYREKQYWPFILVFINTWKSIGFEMLIYYSTIISIDREMYEAAEIDGATRFQQIRSITLPLIRPTVITLLILHCGNIFRSDFGLFFQVPMNQGALYSVTDTIDTFVYRSLMEEPNIALSSAAGFYQSLVGFALVMLVNSIVRRISREQAIF